MGSFPVCTHLVEELVYTNPYKSASQTNKPAHPNGAIDPESVKRLNPAQLGLFQVVCGSNHYALRMLAKSGQSLDFFDQNGTTLMHSAARMGDHRIVEELLRLGCSKAPRDKNGHSAIDVASFYRKNHILKLLNGNMEKQKSISQLSTETSIQDLTHNVKYEENTPSKKIDVVAQDCSQHPTSSKSEPNRNDEQSMVDIQMRREASSVFRRSKSLQQLVQLPKSSLRHNNQVSLTVFNKNHLHAVMYLLLTGQVSNVKQLGRYLYQNRLMIADSLFSFLTNPKIRNLSQIVEQYIQMVIEGDDSLFASLSLLFQDLPLQLDIVRINYLCDMFSRVYSRHHSLSLQDTGCVQRLGFLTVIHNYQVFHLSQTTNPFLEQGIFEECTQLDLDPKQFIDYSLQRAFVSKLIWPLPSPQEDKLISFKGQSMGFSQIGTSFSFFGKKTYIYDVVSQNSREYRVYEMGLKGIVKQHAILPINFPFHI